MLGHLNRVEAALTPFDAGGPAAIHSDPPLPGFDSRLLLL